MSDFFAGEDFSNGFEELVADLNQWRAWRDRQDAEVAERARRTETEDLVKAFRQSDHDHAVWHAEMQRRLRLMKAHAEQGLERAEADLVAARASRRTAERRLREQRREHNREQVLQEIPSILSKALELQRAGKCSAHDVAVVQARCQRLAEQWF